MTSENTAASAGAVGYRWRIEIDGCSDEHSRWVLTELLPEFEDRPGAKVVVEPLYTGHSAQPNARETALEEALRPFLVEYEDWMDKWPDSASMSRFARVTFGDLRRAIRALALSGSSSDA